MISGVIIGVLFGYILKRSRFCIAGSVRDIYLEKKNTGLYAILMIIFLQSVIFFGLIQTRLIPKPEYTNYSIIATIVGSLIFGIGAILANGCITSTLLKNGDGRLSGLMSLLGFAIFAVSASKGVLSKYVFSLQNMTIVSDSFVDKLSFPVFYIIVPCLIIVSVLLYRDKKKAKKTIQVSPKYKGFRHIFFEMNWDIRFAAILIGVIAGFSFYFSYLTHRYGGLAITGPIVSSLEIFTGDNLQVSWDIYFIGGIILGSFICSFGSKEYHFQSADGTSLVKSFIGGALMGFSAIMAQGCLVANGLVGTAMLSIHGWLSLIFIALGLWIGAYVWYVAPYKSSILQ